MAEKEKSKEIDYDSLIGDLIEKIDNEKSILRDIDFLTAARPLLIMGFGLSLFALSAYVGSISVTDEVVVFFAVISVFIALGQVTSTYMEKRMIYISYERAVKKFKISREYNPLLKSLIKMKSKNRKFTLGEINKICPEMFTKEKLLENLYE